MNDALPDGHHLGRGLFADVSLDVVRDAVTWEQTRVRAFGKMYPTPRLTAWYGGASYTYSGIRHEPAAAPPVVEALRARLSADLGVEFNSVLCNLYRGGRDSVAWHSDDEPELGREPVIASVSLGASRVFQVRSRGDIRRVWTVRLDHGDLLVMRGHSQRDYEHRVPKCRCDDPRVNLTFRRIVSS